MVGDFWTGLQEAGGLFHIIIMSKEGLITVLNSSNITQALLDYCKTNNIKSPIINLLQARIKAQSKVDTARTMMDAAVKQYGEGSKQAKVYETKLNNAQQRLNMFTISAGDFLRNQQGLATLRLLVNPSITAGNRDTLLTMAKNIKAHNPSLLSRISLIDLYNMMQSGGNLADLAKTRANAPAIPDITSGRFVTINMPKVGPVTMRLSLTGAYNAILGKGREGMIGNIVISVISVGLMFSGFPTASIVIGITKGLIGAGVPN